jgi:crotonobetainyl-CoA:carnitine CoA-transferase CaiB-like acyl-CoA transferase
MPAATRVAPARKTPRSASPAAPIAPAAAPSSRKSSRAPKPLAGVRVLSLALNLPGPAALMRCRQMGATCVKLEAPAGDPMQAYAPHAYAAMHEGVRVLQGDLKTEEGQALLHRELARTDVLLTSFRPSALTKLDLGWRGLSKLYPTLSQVAIVGAAGVRAEEPGHDLTYLAEHGLVPGLELPATLYADMSGSLMASEAVLQAVLVQRGKGKGTYIEVALAEAARYLGLPRTWGLTLPAGAVGGAHAGYRVYPCKDGRVAVAALEPHFAKALCKAAGVHGVDYKGMMTKEARDIVASFLLRQTRGQLERLALAEDIPLLTMK